MTSLVTASILVLLATGGTLVFFTRRKHETRAQRVLHHRKPLTQPQEPMFHRLTEALPGHMILAHVPVSRLLTAGRGASAFSWLKRIRCLSADFVVCGRDSSVLAVIELEDYARDEKRRRLLDTMKDEALVMSGIRVLRWNASHLPEVQTIREAIAPSLLRSHPPGAQA